MVSSFLVGGLCSILGLAMSEASDPTTRCASSEGAPAYPPDCCPHTLSPQEFSTDLPE